ncbi:MAG TPA: STAS domain-containing protein [Longimicrobium sp.]|nr:STAS domain-containing protein [Longimicrobium sp.]
MNLTTLRVAAPRMITIKNSAALRNHLLDRLEEGARDFVIGLENTTYVDSSGLALFADLQRVLVREMGMRLRLSGARPEIRLLLEATRLAAVLELVDTADVETTDSYDWVAPEDWTARPMVGA